MRGDHVGLDADGAAVGADFAVLPDGEVRDVAPAPEARVLGKLGGRAIDHENDGGHRDANDGPDGDREGAGDSEGGENEANRVRQHAEADLLKPRPRHVHGGRSPSKTQANGLGVQSSGLHHEAMRDGWAVGSHGFVGG